MRPIKLTLENIGPFSGKTIIDFSALDDVFLISGRTGSGKTTIFDAICFALYGSLPGNRSNHVNRIKSDYASKDDESFVSMEFSIGKKLYRIERSPKQEKQKKRGTGFSFYDETAVLYELNDGQYDCISSKKSEADNKIIELLGLSKDEFFKIVLLPQGEFAEFLKQNTTHRKEVLQKLFPVEKAAAIREYILNKAKILSAQKSEIERSLEDISKRFVFDAYEDLQKKAKDEAAECKQNIKMISDKQSVLKQVLQITESLSEKNNTLINIQNEFLQLENQQEEIFFKENKLKKSREAQPLMQYIVLHNENYQTLQKIEETLNNYLTKEEDARNQLNYFKTNSHLEKKYDDEIIILRKQKVPLEELVKDEEALNTNQKELQILKQKSFSLANDQQSTMKFLSDLEAELQILLSQTKDAQKYESDWEEKRNIKEWLMSAKKIAEQIYSTNNEIKDFQIKINQNINEQKLLEKNIPVLKDEIRILEKEKEQSEKGNLAALLAVELKYGVPCPVCGSKEHPSPAPAADPKFGIDERINTQKHLLDDAEKKLIMRKSEFQSFEMQLNKTEKNFSQLKNELHAIPEKDSSEWIHNFLEEENNIPSLEKINQKLSIQVNELNKIFQIRDTAKKSQLKIPKLYSEKENLQLTLSKIEKEQSVIQEQMKHLELSINIQKEKHEKILQDWKTDSLSNALQIIEKQIDESLNALQSFRKNKEDAQKNFTAVITEKEISLKQKIEYQNKFQEAKHQLDEKIKSSSFQNAEELQNAFLSKEDETLFQNTIDTWKHQFAENKLLHQELIKSIDELQTQKKESGIEEDENGIHNLINELIAQQNEAEQKHEAAVSDLASLKKDADLWKEILQKHDTISKEAQAMKSLSDDLVGNNPKRMAFDSWLLGLYLQEVAAYASRRLERMSESRYSLLLDIEGDSARGRAGLDLAVFDAYTGKTRPCTTLSGGESFMASISLALGLADSIQNRSGGIRLDAVFIDEGFGSLDEASLDKALIILDELREHRMVGLISHVGEMRNRIPSQIEVHKTGSGSNIIIRNQTNI
jgi:exonuclease SbcC